MPPPVISRIAPTPSGYLHLGNAVNFLLTWLCTRHENGTLHLRIDDLDRHRCRREYVDDVFSSLEWLGIEPDAGPSGTGEFYCSYSQTLRYDAYRDVLRQLGAGPSGLYACDCSRKTLDGFSRYPGFCREKGLVPVAGKTAVRLPIPESTAVHFGPSICKPAEVFGDIIVWRKDEVPAYQLVSILEDMRLQTSLVIRGTDLIDSSAVQYYLAHLFGAEHFLNARFIHHPLVRRKDGQKFSKSDRDYSLRDLRTSLGEAAAKRVVIEQTCAMLGLDSRGAATLQPLLERYNEGNVSRPEIFTAAMV